MIKRCNLFGNENIGVFGWSCDDYCLVGSGIEKKNRLILEEILKVPIYEVNISQAKIVHTLSIGNKKGILAPRTIRDDELDILKKICGVATRIPHELTAIGNHILCNDNGAIFNPEYNSTIRKIIEDTLDIEAVPYNILKNEPGLVGTHAICNNKGVLIHSEADEEKLKEVSDILKVKADFGTLNLGYYPGAGGIVNSNGGVVGNETTGPEIMHLGITLGLND
ncbi:MAG: translation initiation factor IF-6 [Candidatus Lokiarchaeota archaeon]|nr:translation initiation factor IF-6 [Candidatus Lokiarchaeota archaeon]